ncbi:hypothetical protein IAQ61_010720, partial [Plenodomus lingam]|uniref:Predicted protein n=1 Tax=Leptosphaeria maculans (strain JN3 / isolate v23.1.3 / race Av1-4-5-6-7-8) TaxID=985895 RepID=E4ZJS8_LEPMJ
MFQCWEMVELEKAGKHVAKSCQEDAVANNDTTSIYGRTYNASLLGRARCALLGCVFIDACHFSIDFLSNICISFHRLHLLPNHPNLLITPHHQANNLMRTRLPESHNSTERPKRTAIQECSWIMSTETSQYSLITDT